MPEPFDSNASALKDAADDLIAAQEAAGGIAPEAAHFVAISSVIESYMQFKAREAAT